MSKLEIKAYIAMFMTYVLIRDVIEPCREWTLSISEPLATILLVQQVEIKKN